MTVQTIGCDYAACDKPAVASAGGWSFCDKHSEDDAALRQGQEPVGEALDSSLLPARANGHGTDAGYQRHIRAGAQPCDLCTEAHRITYRDRLTRRSTPPTPQEAAMTAPASIPSRPFVVPGSVPSPINQLLEQASAHSSAKVRRLAERIESQLDDLREVIRATAKQEAARKAAEAERAKAKADVERLAAELAAARAKLGPAKKKSGTSRPKGPVTDGGQAVGPQPCAGCGGQVTRAAGTAGRWPSQCATCKSSAA